MTPHHLTYFFYFCLYSLIYQLSIYAHTILDLQPLLLFLSLNIMFIPSDQLLFYFDVSQHYITICLDSLWRQNFQLDTNIVYIVDHDNDDIIFEI